MDPWIHETPSKSPCIEPLRSMLFAAGALSLVACGNDATSLVPALAVIEPLPASEGNGSAVGGVPAPRPLYLAASWVSDAELTNTYVSVFDSLEVETLDFTRALEIPGYGDAWVFDGRVFIADGETPKVGRHSLDERGRLALEVEIDFSNHGVAGAAFWDLDAGDDDWELYGIDFGANTVTPTGIRMSDGSYYESHVDGRYFVYLASGPSDTQVYERTPIGYDPKFQAGGWMSRLFRLR